ncbi:hypothetical protein ACFX2I_047096 [Malus domestica]
MAIKQVTAKKWKKPEVGGLKCNFDGALEENGETGGVGLVFRDEMGEFVAAMALKQAGVSSPLMAEMMAARSTVINLSLLSRNPSFFEFSFPVRPLDLNRRLQISANLRKSPKIVRLLKLRKILLRIDCVCDDFGFVTY